MRSFFFNPKRIIRREFPATIETALNTTRLQAAISWIWKEKLSAFEEAELFKPDVVEMFFIFGFKKFLLGMTLSTPIEEIGEAEEGAT